MSPTEERSGRGAASSTTELVLEWRLKELIAAGYESGDALLLAAEAEVDLHLATELPRRGCPYKTALHILL